MAGAGQIPFQTGVSTSKPPSFTGENYLFWKSRIEIHISSVDYTLWSIIIDGPKTPMKKKEDGTSIEKPQEEYGDEDNKLMTFNDRAFNLLLCALNQTEHSRVMGLKTAQDVWKKLEITHEGTSQVKDAKIGRLVRQFELFTMEPGEIISILSERLDSIVTKLSLLGKTYAEKEIVTKILSSLPKEWDSKVTAIEEAKDQSTLKVDELVGNLITHEIRMKEEADPEQKFWTKGRIF